MIVPEGYAACKLIWTQTGDPDEMISTFGVRLASGVTNPVTVATEIRQDFLTAFPLSQLDSGYTFQGAEVTMGSSSGDGPTGESISAGAGSSGGTSLPSNCALLVKKTTALGGRINRGRMFLPAGYLYDASTDELGVLDSTYRTTMQTSATAFLNAITGGTNYDAMVILHSKALSTPPVVTALTVDTKIATQRRRMRR